MATLGEIIKDFRISKKPKMSMDQFAELSNLSKSYISMLEHNKDPRGKPIVPTIDTINKVANAMNVSFDTIFNQLDSETLVGGKIRQRRIELGLSQAELAARLGYKSRNAICNVENDKEDLTITRVKKFADALGVTPAYLIGFKEPTTHYEIIDYYNQLNETGRQDLIKYAKYLASNEETRKEV